MSTRHPSPPTAAVGRIQKTMSSSFCSSSMLGASIAAAATSANNFSLSNFAFFFSTTFLTRKNSSRVCSSISKMTSRHVNALEYVLIPRIEVVIAYIILEMDEQTREEFFRVKKVVEKKKAKLEKEKL